MRDAVQTFLMFPGVVLWNLSLPLRSVLSTLFGGFQQSGGLTHGWPWREWLSVLRKAAGCIPVRALPVAGWVPSGACRSRDGVALSHTDGSPGEPSQI